MEKEDEDNLCNHYKRCEFKKFHSLSNSKVKDV